MNFIIILILLFVLLIVFINPYSRCVLFNIPSTFYNGIIDIYKYFKYRLYNKPDCGHLYAYTGLFGKGKTLSCVADSIRYYKKYNGKKWFDVSKNCLVVNRVLIVSNVHIKPIPYIKFDSLSTLLRLCESTRSHDVDSHIHTAVYVVGDEFSTMLNSRNFKSNLNPLALAMLLQSRKYSMTLTYTTQRFNHVDALLRQVTETVYECDKKWRLMKQSVFDAYELENGANPLLIKPLRTISWFVSDKYYNAYDTYSLADTVRTSCESGDMLDSNDIIELLNGESEHLPTRFNKKGKKLYMK